MMADEGERAMIDHLEIADKRRELERDRREKVSEALAAYDKAHNASLTELREACGRIGHHWNYGTAHAHVVCQVCGAVK
jgi:hypothetical protein